MNLLDNPIVMLGLLAMSMLVVEFYLLSQMNKLGKDIDSKISLIRLHLDGLQKRVSEDSKAVSVITGEAEDLKRAVYNVLDDMDQLKTPKQKVVKNAKSKRSK